MNFMYKSIGAKDSNWQLSQNNQYVSYALLSLGAVLCIHIMSRGGPVKLDSMWQHRLTRPLHVPHTYYCIIYKQNPFNIISRGVQR